MAAIRPIRTALAAACALAGVHADRAGAQVDAQATEVEGAVMLYSESQRVLALEPVVQVKHPLSDTRTLSLKVVLDGLTGASPNGAVPSTQAQTFTRPSGSSSYIAAPNSTPLDDAFSDKRGELDVALEQRHGLLTRASYGGHVSLEQDYSSVGADLVFKREFDRRNRMLTLGLSGSLDRVSPQGGAPTVLAEMAAPSESESEGEGEGEGAEAPGESKNTADLLVGFTQIVDRSTVAQLNYSASRSGGYLNDPYKFVSVVAPGDSPDAGEPVRQLYESRPDSRLKQSLFGRLKRHLGRDVVDLSYRYLWDDWNIRSQTAALRYILRYREGDSLEPGLRWYRQTAADFYRHSLVDGEGLPAHASADPRLAAFDAWTYGLRWRHTLASGREISLRAEYYRQRGDSHPADAVGQLKSQDLFPDLDAVVFEVGWRFDLPY